MGILEKIAEIEREIARTQKNKGEKNLEIPAMLLFINGWYVKVQLNSNEFPSFLATEYHLGTLKAKLAKYRTQLLEPSGKKGEKGEGFEVLKSGDARVAMIGFPSVGKSTLLSSITKTESEQASYEFTTLTCIPGNTEY